MKYFYAVVIAGVISTAAQAAEPLTTTESKQMEPAATPTTDTTVVIESEQTTETAAPGMQSESGTATMESSTQQAASPEQSGFSRGSVVRSVFTTQIDNREPVDDVKAVDTAQDNIIYFTELRDMEGQVARHRWEYNGEVMAEVDFSVRGPRWRVWSSKSFVPQWAGEWKVSVVNGAGEVISEDLLTYTGAQEPVLMDTPATTGQDSSMSEPPAAPSQQ